MLAAEINVLGNTPASNPGFLVTIPQPLYTVDTSETSVNNYTLYSVLTKQEWLFNYNFNRHPLVAVNGQTVTGVSFTTVSPNDSTLIVNSSSLYNNNIGLILVGGVVSRTYRVTVGATLSGGNVVSTTLNLTVQ